MGKTARKYCNELVLFKRKFKKPLSNIAVIMPIGFSDDLFYSQFKKYYSYLWEDILEKSSEYKRMDEGLIKKGFPKRYFFPYPDNYLKNISKPHVNTARKTHEIPATIVDLNYQTALREELVVECNKKLAKRENKKNENLKFVQLTTPEYSNYYIENYFKIKKSNPVDVHSRYAVILEASKYKSLATIKFLHQVNSSERNFQLRNFAFTTLQKFGVSEVRLRKNRKGKKHTGDLLDPIKIENPDELITHIYNSQLEQSKKYDLFLSHSSLDAEILLELKAVLNGININVYIDWVSDRNSLKRELTNVNTANVVIERLKSSSALMYVHTTASLNSKWAPWEIGYFHALKNKICIYFKDKTETIPSYLDIYPIASLKNGAFIICDKEREYNIKEWIAIENEHV